MSSNPNPRKALFNKPINTSNVSPLEALRMATGEANANRAVELPLDQIKVDESIQVRVEGLHEETVIAYTAILENGGELDPVTVIRDEYGDYELADGFHRYEAHVRAGKVNILSYVRDGGHDAALEEAEEGNLRHGRPLTNDDKRNILRRRVRRNHPWAQLSTRELGKLLGVGHNTIKRWLNEFDSSVPNGTVDRRQIVGADGRVRDVSNIGKTARPMPVEVPTQPMPSPISFPTGVEMRELDKGEDAPYAFVADDVGQARVREAQVRLPLRAIGEAVKKLLETRNLQTLNENFELDDRLLLADELLDGVERELDFVHQLMECFPRETIMDYIPQFSAIDKQMQAIANWMEDKIREI